MLGIIALSLLGIGATAFLIDEIVDDDDGRSSPSTPGEEDEMPDAGDADPTIDPETEGLISGSTEADALAGTDTSEPILAGLGDDIVRAGAGDDVVGAGDGDDRVFGEEGEDTLFGQDGNDFLRGGSSDDVLIDTEGADTLRGDAGDDVIFSTGITDPDAVLAGVIDPAQAPVLDPSQSINDLEAFDLSVDNDTQGDLVDGGVGDDAIFFGTDDTVTGGEGMDFFVGGTPLIAGNPATITDFDPADETLVFTTETPTPPDLTITFDGDDATVLLAGQAAVLLPGVGADFDADSVEFVQV